MGSHETCPTCGSSQRDVYAGCRVVVEGRYSPDPWHTTPPAPADDAGGAEAVVAFAILSLKQNLDDAIATAKGGA